MSMASSRARGRLVLTGGGLAPFLAVPHAVADAATGMFAALLPALQARFGPGETAPAGLIVALARRGLRAVGGIAPSVLRRD